MTTNLPNVKFSWEFLRFFEPPLIVINNDATADFEQHKNRLIWWAWQRIKQDIDGEGKPVKILEAPPIEGRKEKVTRKWFEVKNADTDWAKSGDLEICKDEIDEKGVNPENIVDAFIKGEGIQYFSPKPRMDF